MSKVLSSQAQVAKLIKEFCKSINIKCSAKSDSFSMGDSVHYTVENVSPETFRKIEEYANQFQYGHFNGMEDIYEYSNRRNDIPQTKYISGSNDYSNDFYQKAYELLKNSASNGDDKPELYEDAKNLQWCSDEWSYEDQINRYVYKILRGSTYAHDYISELSNKFWAAIEAESNNTNKAIQNNQQIGGAYIEEHTHTKLKFQMFIVIIPDRLDAETFKNLCEYSKAFGGWYSRKWEKTPGGFAFKSLENAQKFIAEHSEANKESQSDSIKQSNVNETIAAKLKLMADNMQADIDNKMQDRLTNTQKRIAQDRQAKIEGERLIRTQTVLNKLAELHLNGSISPILSTFKTKKQIYDLVNTKKELVANGYHSYYSCTGQPAITTEEAAAIWALINPKTEEQKQKELIDQKIKSLQFANIPGYFPTPKEVISLMVEKAEISANDRILEPSAGHGAICDYVAPLCKEVKAFEANYTLAEILDFKDYLIEKAQDFLNVDPVSITSYEKILMNPPFENLQDIEHVKHAYKFLKNGGRLVSIMSPGGFFRSDKKAADFRAWLDGLDAEILDIPAGAFKESNTNISTKMLIINK